MDQKKEYYAFISYKREDERWAKWLQNKLEHYKIPVAVRKKDTSLPAYVRPVFKDTTDLSGGVLEKAIDEALSQSRYLIVICSPRAAQSPWVCKEVQHFIDSGREEYIIPFIIEGLPNSEDIALECFPKNLRELTGARELLGININEMGRAAAMVKVVARMFRLEFDILWRRYEKEKRRKLLFGVLAAAVLLITALGAAGLIFSKNLELNRQYALIEDQNIKLDSTNMLILQSNDSLEIQHKRLVQANEDLSRQKQLLDIEYDNVKKANQEMMINKARYIAGMITRMTEEGERYDAQRLSWTIWDEIEAEGLEVQEVETALKYAFSYRPSFKRYDNRYLPCQFIPVKKFDSYKYDCEYAVFENDASQLMIYASKGFWGIFDVHTGRMLEDNSMNMNQNGVRMKSIAFSRSKHYAAICVVHPSEGELILVVDNFGQESRFYKNDHYYGVEHLTFSPDEQYLAYTCSLGMGAYSIINLKSESKIVSNKLQDSIIINSLVFSSDSKRFYLTGVGSDAIHTVNVDGKEVAKTTYKKTDDSRPVAYNRVLCAGNGKLYAADSRHIGVINETDMSVEMTLSGHESMVSAASLCSDRYLASGDSGGFLYVWDLQTLPFPLQTIKLHNDEISHIDCSDDGNWIVTCSKEHNARLLGKYRYLEPYDYDVVEGFETVTYSDSSNVVIAADGRIYEMVMSSGNVVWETIMPENDYINEIESSRDGKLLAVPQADSSIVIYANGQYAFHLKGHNDGVDALSFNNDGTRLASITSSDNQVIIWDISGEKADVVLELGDNSGIEHDVEYSYDGTQLLLCSETEARLYDTKEWDYVVCKAKSSSITGASLSPDGTSAVICFDDQSVILWDFIAGKTVWTTRWQKKLNGTAYSHNGKYIAVTSDDGWLNVWDIVTGESVLEYQINGSTCMNPQFNRSDTAILCEGYSGFYEVGLYGTNTYVNYIKNTFASHPMTEEERRQFFL